MQPPAAKTHERVGFWSRLATIALAVVVSAVPAAPQPAAADVPAFAVLKGVNDFRWLTSPAIVAPLHPPTVRTVAANVNVGDFSDFLAFIAAAPLAASDRERISDAAHDQLRRHPLDVQEADSALRTFFLTLGSEQRFQKAGDRERLRFALEMLPENDTFRQVLDQTDPVIVVDRANKLIVTEATLTAWQSADDWATTLLGAPRPDAGFAAAQRAYLKANFATLSAERADAIAHLERNRYAMEIVLEQTHPDKRAAYLRASRSFALDGQRFPQRLADVMEQAYEAVVKEREPFPCLDRGQPGADVLTPDMRAKCD
jgi:hypothetical protein